MGNLCSGANKNDPSGAYSEPNVPKGGRSRREEIVS